MRSNEEITTQSGRSRCIRLRSADNEVSLKTGTPRSAAKTRTGSTVCALASTARITPTTSQADTSDCNAVGAVMPMPTRRTLCTDHLGGVQRLQAIVSAASDAAAQQPADLQSPGLQADD